MSEMDKASRAWKAYIEGIRPAKKALIEAERSVIKARQVLLEAQQAYTEAWRAYKKVAK